ncbi:MAG TPA: DUF2092 domain-containing protein [Devosiaceae bacterium]|jgi:hypothetical protein
MLDHPRTLLCLICVLALTGPAAAQPAPPLRDAAGAIATTASADAIEPDAIAALKAMGEALAAQQSFDLKTSFEADLSLDNDQNIEIGGTVHYLAERPDRLRVELASDLGQRVFVFDGQSLYVISENDKVYGQLDDVGPTIKDMLESVAYYADIELPLADLFDWGTADAPTNAVTGAFLVGKAEIDGEATRHWAFRTADKDFQVWIKDGDAALPLKMVIEDNSGTRPRFEVNLAWGDAKPPADAFTFTPPPDATPIPIVLRDAGEVSK